MVAWNLIKPILERGKELNQIRANAGRSGGLNGKGISRNVGNVNAKTKAKQKQNKSKQKQINSGGGIGEGIGIGIGEGEEENKFSSLDLSFVSEEFLSVVKSWLEYKKERNEEYKQKGVKAFYNKLQKLSNGDVETAKTICEDSMSANYAGIFPLKERKAKEQPQGMVLAGNRNEVIENSKGWQQ